MTLLFCCFVFCCFVGPSDGYAQTKRQKPKPKPTEQSQFELQERKRQEQEDLLKLKEYTEQALGFEDLRWRTEYSAKLADIVWTRDPEYAREVFRRAYEKLVTFQSDDPRKVVEMKRFKLLLIGRLSRRDPAAAQKLGQELGESEFSQALIQSAGDLITDERIPEAVAQLRRAFEGKVNFQSGIQLLNRMLALKPPPPEADELYQVLLQKVTGPADLLDLATYLAPGGRMGYVMIGTTGSPVVPRLRTAKAHLARGYIEAGCRVLKRLADDLVEGRPVSSDDRKLAFILFSQLQGRNEFPEFDERLINIGGILTQAVEAQFRDETSRMLQKADEPMVPPDLASLDGALQRLVGDAHDMMVMNFVASKLRTDYDAAATATERFKDLDLKVQVMVVVRFSQGKQCLERNSNPACAQEFAKLLPARSVERALLYLALGRHWLEKDRFAALESLNAAVSDARELPEAELGAHIAVGAAGELAKLDQVTALGALKEGMKIFNRGDKTKIETAAFTRFVRKGPASWGLSLPVAGTRFDLGLILESTPRDQIDIVEAVVLGRDGVSNEKIKGGYLVRLAQRILAPPKKK